MKGYIAITTTIILALVMILLTVGLGTAGVFSRFNAHDFNNKQRSRFLAWACLDYARLKLAQNSSYAGNEAINVDESRQCTIKPIEISGANKIIKARAQLKGATTNLKLTVVAASLSTVSLEEIVKF